MRERDLRVKERERERERERKCVLERWGESIACALTLSVSVCLRRETNRIKKFVEKKM